MKILERSLPTFLYYLIAPLLVIAITIFYFFQAKIIDEESAKALFVREGDAIANISIIKFIAKDGLSFCSKFLGYPQIDTGCYYDYAVEHNILYFLIIKFFLIFSQNPLIVAFYVILTVNALISFSANFTLRQFGITKFSSAVLAVLFSFTLMRIYYFFVFSIGNYYPIPLIILSAYYFYERKVIFIGLDKDLKYIIKPNRYALFSMLVALSALTSSAYYGYALIVIHALIVLMYLMRYNKFDHIFISICCFIFISLVMAILITLPTLIFWYNNGLIDIIARHPIESINHGISISSMLIPRSNHLLEAFNDFSSSFRMVYSNIYLYGEKGWGQIGLLASSGFCFLLLMILSSFINPKKISERRFLGINYSPSAYNLLSFIALLNILLILFLTVESFSSFLHFYFSSIRGVGRLNVIFIFIALIFWGLLVDQIIARTKNSLKIYFIKSCVLLIAVLSFLDIAGPRLQYHVNNEKNKITYNDYKKFVNNIENSLPSEAMIFMMPVKGFPEDRNDNYSSTIAYFFSDRLKLSYPTPKKRQSHLWQLKVANLDFDDFIKEIKDKGFAGVWIQRDIFVKIHDFDIKEFESNLQKISKNKIQTDDKKFVFYEI